MKQNSNIYGVQACKSFLSSVLFLGILGLIVPVFCFAQVAPDRLSKETRERVERVPEFKFIIEEANKLGVKVYLFGGTASAFAHYLRWDLEREAGDVKYQPERFDYDFTNIYRGNQDLDIVVDGTEEQAQQLQSILQEHYPHFVGSKDAWEVRLLRGQTGDKLPLLDDFDFKNQHTDTNSTGMVALNAEEGEIVYRDLRDWENAKSTFLNDVAAARIQFWYSKNHKSTSRFKEGKNPSILAAIRYVAKLTQYEVLGTEEDLRQITKIIQGADVESLSSYSKTKAAEFGEKALINAPNIEFASDLLDSTGLRALLLEIDGKKISASESLSWWLNKEPLRSFELGEGSERTARQIFENEGLGEELIVSHETRSFHAYENITRSSTGGANVFISRKGHSDEGAAFGDGFYTRVGKKGAVGSGLTIRFQLNPEAREGTDFIFAGGDYFVILNKNALRLIQEDINLSPVDFLKLLMTGDIGSTDKGLIEKFRRKFKRNPLSSEEAEELRKIILSKLKDGESFHAPAISFIFNSFSIFSILSDEEALEVFSRGDVLEDGGLFLGTLESMSFALDGNILLFRKLLNNFYKFTLEDLERSIDARFITFLIRNAKEFEEGLTAEDVLKIVSFGRKRSLKSGRGSFEEHWLSKSNLEDLSRILKRSLEKDPAQGLSIKKTFLEVLELSPHVLNSQSLEVLLRVPSIGQDFELVKKIVGEHEGIVVSGAYRRIFRQPENPFGHSMEQSLELFKLLYRARKQKERAQPGDVVAYNVAGAFAQEGWINSSYFIELLEFLKSEKDEAFFLKYLASSDEFKDVSNYEDFVGILLERNLKEGFLVEVFSKDHWLVLESIQDRLIALIRKSKGTKRLELFNELGLGSVFPMGGGWDAINADEIKNPGDEALTTENVIKAKYRLLQEFLGLPKRSIDLDREIFSSAGDLMLSASIPIKYEDVEYFAKSPGFRDPVVWSYLSHVEDVTLIKTYLPIVSQILSSALSEGDEGLLASLSAKLFAKEQWAELPQAHKMVDEIFKNPKWHEVIFHRVLDSEVGAGYPSAVQMVEQLRRSGFGEEKLVNLFNNQSWNELPESDQIARELFASVGDERVHQSLHSKQFVTSQSLSVELFERLLNSETFPLKKTYDLLSTSLWREHDQFEALLLKAIDHPKFKATHMKSKFGIINSLFSSIELIKDKEFLSKVLERLLGKNKVDFAKIVISILESQRLLLPEQVLEYLEASLDILKWSPGSLDTVFRKKRFLEVIPDQFVWIQNMIDAVTPTKHQEMIFFLNSKRFDFFDHPRRLDILAAYLNKLNKAKMKEEVKKEIIDVANGVLFSDGKGWAEIPEVKLYLKANGVDSMSVEAFWSTAEDMDVDEVKFEKYDDDIGMCYQILSN